MRHVIFILFSPNEQRGGGRGVRCQTFPLCSPFSVQQTTSGIGHRVKLFFGLANNTLNVRNNYNKNHNLVIHMKL